MLFRRHEHEGCVREPVRSWACAPPLEAPGLAVPALAVLPLSRDCGAVSYGAGLRCAWVGDAHLQDDPAWWRRAEQGLPGFAYCRV